MENMISIATLPTFVLCIHHFNISQFLFVYKMNEWTHERFVFSESTMLHTLYGVDYSVILFLVGAMLFVKKTNRESSYSSFIFRLFSSSEILSIH
jgi:hypothetical protein